MMADQLFTGSRLKITRANQHIQELQACLFAFLSTDFYRLSGEKDYKIRRYVLKFEMTTPIPHSVALLVGDAVHNLRSALDQLAYELVVRAGRTPNNDLRFPFWRKREEMIGKIKQGERQCPIVCIGPDLIQLIVDGIKPYRGGNDALYGLHAIDIAGTHRLLIPTLSVFALTGICGADDAHNRVHNHTSIINHVGPINIIETTANFHITSYGKPSIDVLFGEGGDVFQGHRILPTLHQLSQLVAGIIDQCAEVILSRA